MTGRRARRPAEPGDSQDHDDGARCGRGAQQLECQRSLPVAKVRYFIPHGMRRTCASLLAALDVHPRVAMRILRHSKIAVTMEIYTEVPDDTTRDALRRLGEQLGG